VFDKRRNEVKLRVNPGNTIPEAGRANDS
jgi:hypothetical protein